MRKRRIVRIFRLERIYAFIFFICFIITATAVAFSFRKGTLRLEVKPHLLYALSIGKNNTESEITELAKECVQKGGAGYIYEKGDTFYCIAAVYFDRISAKSVLSGLKNNSAEIVEIATPSLYFPTSAYDKQINDALSFCLSVLPKYLETDSIAFAKGELSVLAVAEKCMRYGDYAGKLSLPSALYGETSDTHFREINELLDRIAITLTDVGASGNMTVSKIRYLNAVCAIDAYKTVNEIPVEN